MKTVLLFSGGIDSTTLLYELRAQGHEVWTLFCDYGQSHYRQERRTAEAIARDLAVPHYNAHLPRDLFAGSQLTGADEGRLGPGGVQVPNRNMTMIALAGSVAERYRLDHVAVACHADDHALFPDCRPPFLRAADDALRAATEHRVTLLRPYAHITKDQIVARAHQLGVPLERTYSCYRGGTYHCGECLACKERDRALAGEPFVLERVENPHPKMLAGALEARAGGGPFWDGYLRAMADATGEAEEALIAWMERVG